MSTGRTPGEALQEHQALLQRLISCVSYAVVSIQRPRHSNDRHVPLVHHFMLANGERVALRGGVPVLVNIAQECRIQRASGREDQYSILVTGYVYIFTLPNESEILAYHWHPDGRSHIVDPHLHIGPAAIGTNAPFRPGTMQKAHLPTGFVPLASVIRMAIEELGVEPRRPDWDAILR